MSKVTMRDVAERAGVSPGTVSNAMSKPHKVAASTVERVNAAARELGFVRNENARLLKMGRSNTVGMLVFSLSNPFFASLADLAGAAAEERDLELMIASSNQSPTREDHYIELFEQQRVRGLMITPVHGVPTRLRDLLSRGVPAIVLGTADGDECCSVASDGSLGAYLAARHLLEQGRRNLWFVGGPLFQLEDRWEGVQRAVAEFPGSRLTRVDTADQSSADGYEVGMRIAAEPGSRPDAICAANDLIAIGILEALRTTDVDVPRDIAITGYDDIPHAAQMYVPLTSIRQPLRDIVDTALDLLDAETSAEEHRHRHVLIPPLLVPRASSGT